MAELGKYTKALQSAQRKEGIIPAKMERLSRRTARMIDTNQARRAELLDEIAERRRERWLAAKRRALEMLCEQDDSSNNEAERRRKRWLTAKRRAIRVLLKTRNG